jgi:hypothetical protein
VFLNASDDYLETVPVTVDQLEVFRDVLSIEHYLAVQGVNVPGFTSLSFLRNLRTIKGQKLSRGYLVSLYKFRHNLRASEFILQKQRPRVVMPKRS